MPPLTPSERMDRLNRDIVQMRILADRFFNGAPGVSFPDVERERTRIQAELRRLRNAQLTGVEEHFRLSSLEGKFNSYSERFQRRVRRMEEGTPLAGPRSERAERPDARAGVVLDDRMDRGAVEALYESLLDASGGRPRFDLDSFRTYLDRQLSAIRTKTGCERVVFRVAEEDGKTKLKARPVEGT
ncbi:MAG TPA: MXAN_5187 C-terminal domain-containing protein [Thermoanaerobaculia bacterium]